MAINWTEAEIEEVIASVIKNLRGDAFAKDESFDSKGYSGSVSSVESAFVAIRAYVMDKLGYTCCEITKT